MRKTMLALTLAVATLSAAVVPVSALGTASEGEPPLADAGLDQRVTVGASVTLDATGSRDPDGRLVSYRWRVETPDGRTTVPTPPNRGRTSLTVTEPGRYEVTVTVTDDDGNTASDTLYIVVDGTPTATPEPSTPPLSTATPEQPSRTPSTTSTSPTSGTTGPSTSRAASAPTGTAAPASAGLPAANPSASPAADCTGTFGPDCITGPDCADPAEMDEGCIELLRIEGPDTLGEGETGTYTAVTDGFDGDVSFRWQAGELSRSVERSFSPGEHTVVVTATDGESTYVAEKTVYVGRNAPPKVSIADPGELEPGASVVLSLNELSDPDGTVTTVSWTGGSRVRAARGMDNVRSVTVPDGNDTKRVEVTAVDDDGESATDVLVITSSKETDLNYVEQPTTRTAQCTYYEYGGKTTDQPIRCWNKATGEVIYDRDPNEGADDFVGPHSHPDWDVDWYRVSRPDDDTIKPGSAMAKDVGAPTDPIQIENTDRANSSAPRNQTLVNTVKGADSSPGFEPYHKDGESVATDLTGDGRVDLQDWQERYGDPTAKSVENDEERVKSMKTESRDQAAGDSGDSDESNQGLAGTVQDAFDDLADSMGSVVSDNAGSDESSDEDSSQSSPDTVQDTVSDTVDAVTEAFDNLGSNGTEDGSESSESSASTDDTGSTTSDTDSGQSCSTSALGFEICL